MATYLGPVQEKAIFLGPPEKKEATYLGPQKGKAPVYLGPVKEKPTPIKTEPSFSETRTDKYIREHPNIYGAYGAAKGIAEGIGKFGFFKYGDPYEIKQFFKKTPEEQKRQLLTDTAETLGLIGGEALAARVGYAAEAYFPRAYKVVKEILTKPRMAPKLIRGIQSKGVKVMDLIGKRRADIDVGMLESEHFIRQFEREFTKAELEAVPFLREGMKNPNVLSKMGREDLIPILKKPSPELLKATEKIGKYYDDSFQFLKDNWGDVSFVEDYVTHIWDIPKGRKSEIVNYFATKNPFLNKRTIPTLQEGIALGLKPKTTNIAELLRIYDQYKFKTVYNYNFAKHLKGLTDDAGNPLMARGDKAPKDWVKIDHPALNRAMAIGKVGKEGILLKKVPVRVHPDIAREVKIITDNPFSGKAINATNTVNAFIKKGIFAGSLFHYWSLGEAAMNSGIGAKSLKLFNPWRVYKQLVKGNFEIFANMEGARDAIKYGGVSFGSLSDVQRGVVSKAFQSLEHTTKNIPIVKSGTKAMRKANDLWDSALWDYTHNTMKLWAYEENVFRALKSASKGGVELTEKQVIAIKKSMGDLVNNTFGGQQWEMMRIMGNPKMRQMAQLGFLSPDWTISVLKQATAPAKGMKMMMTGDVTEKMAGKALTKRALLFWFKAAANWNIIAQSANYHNTKKAYGKGRFTWENPPEKKFRIFLRKGKTETDPDEYLYMGKQFLEVMHWGTNGLQTFGSKLNPIVREGIRQLSAHDPGSGYPAEWAEADNEAGTWLNKEGLKQRALSFLEMPLPFTLRSYVENRPHNFMFAFSTSKGMTKYRSVKYFAKAIEKNDKQAVRKIYIHSLENNIDAEAMFNVALSKATQKKTKVSYDDMELAKDIYNELQLLDPKAKEDAIKVYKVRGVMTPKVIKGLLKIEKTQESIGVQKKIFGIK